MKINKNNISLRVSSFILSLIVMFSVIPLTAFAQEDEDTVYIGNLTQLKSFAESCTYDAWSRGKKVYLVSDISLKGQKYRQIPIFLGVFYGNGHTVSDLDIVSDGSPVGFFGIIGNEGYVEKLNVKGTAVSDIGTSPVGGVAGENRGTVRNCSFSGTVSGKEKIGGIVGYNTSDGKIYDCSTDGNTLVTGYTATGGIVGYSDGNISECKNAAFVNTTGEEASFSLETEEEDGGILQTVEKLVYPEKRDNSNDAGGICGYSSGFVIGCINDGNVGYKQIGYNNGGIVGRSCGFISNCENRGFVTGRKDIGGIVGQAEPYAAELLSENMLDTLRSDLDTLNALIGKAANDGTAYSDEITIIIDGMIKNTEQATDIAESLSDGISEFSDETAKEINRESDIISNTVTGFASVSEKLPAITDKTNDALVLLEEGIEYLLDSTKLSVDALEKLLNATDKTAEALAKAEESIDKVMTGTEALRSAVTVEDDDALISSFETILDGLSDTSDAIGSLSLGVSEISDILYDNGWTDEMIKEIDYFAEDIKNIADALDGIYDGLKKISDNVIINEGKLALGSEKVLTSLAELSAAFGAFEEAYPHIENGIGAVSSGISGLITALGMNDISSAASYAASIAGAVAQLTHHSAAIATFASAFAGAMSQISDTSEIPYVLDGMKPYAASLISSLDGCAASLESISQTLSTLLSGVSLNADAINGSSALVLGGFSELQKSVPALKASEKNLSSSVKDLLTGLSSLKEGIALKSPQQISNAASQIGKNTESACKALYDMGSTMSSLADTAGKMKLWADSIIDSFRSVSDSFSAFADALSAVNDGVTEIRDNVDYSLTDMRDALDCLRDGGKIMQEALTDVSDAVSILKECISVLSKTVDGLISSEDKTAQSLSVLTDTAKELSGVLTETKDILKYLSSNEKLELKNINDYTKENTDALFSSFELICGDAKLLSAKVNGTVTALAGDIKSINEQIKITGDHLIDGLNDLDDFPLEGFFTDVSDEDIEQISFGKVFMCTNHGEVYGDISTGGIAGTLAYESAFDPEDDIDTVISDVLKKEYRLKAVLENCVNDGKITGRKNYVSAICGKSELGVITGCEAYGGAVSEEGDYVGGVCGYLCGIAKKCYSKCSLSGRNYVGGIIGGGKDDGKENYVSVHCSVSDCAAIENIKKYAQYAGAISGSNIKNAVGNCFVSEKLGGLCGISYEGKADPLTYDEMMEKEDIPEMFSKLILQFIADGKVLKKIEFTHGQSFDKSVFPQIPQKDGCFAEWDGEELFDLRLDTNIEAVYTPFIKSLKTEEAGENTETVSRKFLADGDFSTSSELNVYQSEKDFALKNGEKLIEKWHVEVSEANGDITLRCRLPEDIKENHAVISIDEEGNRKDIPCETVGSYIVFPISGNKADFAIVEKMSANAVPMIAAAVVLAIIIVLIISSGKNRKNNKK